MSVYIYSNLFPSYVRVSYMRMRLPIFQPPLSFEFHIKLYAKCTPLLYRQTCSVFPELLPRHRAINMFLESYSRKWLESIEDHTPTALCNELLDHQDYLVSHKSSSLPPNHRDPLTQLFTMMKRKATAGEWLVYIPLFLLISFRQSVYLEFLYILCFFLFPSSLDHQLFIDYPNVLSKVCTTAAIPVGCGLCIISFVVFTTDDHRCW